MKIPAKLENGGLEDAFDTFNQVSAQLSFTYQTLQDQVVRLTEELAHARWEKQRQLQEKDRLANRLSLLLESLPGGVVVLDGNGVVQECNPAAQELLGGPLHGEIWWDVVQRAFAPRPDDGHDMSLRSGRRVNIATCSLGHEPGQILLLKDVTETRRLQEQLSQFRRLSAMGEMAASLAHQIRTPVASALLYTSGLGRGKLGTGDRRRYAGKLRGVLQHLESLVRDMLAFARTGGFTLEDITAAEFHAALERCLELDAAAGKLNFSTTNEAGEAMIRGNRDALASAFQNLINNAVQAAGQGVHMDVNLSLAEGDRLRLRIADNGPGVPVDIRERIFEPFVTTRNDGTGLGLAVVRSIIQSHGGSIQVGPGTEHGAVFTIDLPVMSPVRTNPAEIQSLMPAVNFKPSGRKNEQRGKP